MEKEELMTGTGQEVSLAVAILAAAIFVLGLGGLSLCLAWLVIQNLPPEEREGAWRRFLMAWSSGPQPHGF